MWGNDRGWDGWTASPTQWTWVWVKSGSWWWTGRPCVLQFMGSQRIGHDWATELNWTISCSAILFFWLQFFPASGSFPVSHFFTSGGQSIGASALASVLPMNIQDWSPLRWTGLTSLQSKGLSRIFSNTTVQNLLKFMSIEPMMLSNHLIIYHPLLLLPLIFPSIRIFSSESALCIRWPKYWSFSFSIVLPMSIQGWFPLELTGLTSLLSKEFSRVFSYITVQKHQFFSAQPSLWSNAHIHIWLLEKP